MNTPSIRSEFGYLAFTSRFGSLYSAAVAYSREYVPLASLLKEVYQIELNFRQVSATLKGPGHSCFSCNGSQHYTFRRAMDLPFKVGPIVYQPVQQAAKSGPKPARPITEIAQEWVTHFNTILESGNSKTLSSLFQANGMNLQSLFNLRDLVYI